LTHKLSVQIQWTLLLFRRVLADAHAQAAQAVAAAVALAPINT
jgi:hypothetical protein